MTAKRIGVLGAGFMAQVAHLPCFSRLPGVELAALYSPVRVEAEAVAARFGIGRVADSVEALWGMGLDAVLVLSPVSAHQKNVMDALAVGLDVFVEKPLAMAADSARAVAEAARRAGRQLRVGYMKRHDPQVRAARRRIESGAFGRPLYYRAHTFVGRDWASAIDEVVPVFRATEADKPTFDPHGLDAGPAWLKGPRDAKFHSFDHPYFAWLDTGAHTVNLLRYLTGVTPTVEAARNAGGVRRVELDFDGVAGTLEFAVNFGLRRFDEVAELYFERGTVVIATPPPLARQQSAVVDIHSEDGDLAPSTTRLESIPEWSFMTQARSFAEALEKPADTGAQDAEDAVFDLEVIEAVYQKETQA